MHGPSSGSSGEVRLVDLGVVITTHPNDPNVKQIEFWQHEHGPERLGNAVAPFMERLAIEHNLGSVPRLEPNSFPDCVFMSNEIVTLAVHGGTHMDAPYHYGPTCENQPAKQIGDIPLEWCWADGVRLSFTDKSGNEIISRSDVEVELRRIDYTLRPFDIVLIETGWDRRWPDPAYFEEHPAMSVEAIRFLVDQGVKVIGIDTAGFDLPTPTMLKKFALTGDSAHLWPCHMFGREREYLQIERMSGLDRLPPVGFKVACFPVRVAGAGAGWVRPVAMVSD